jgi:hypothetical protein
MSEKEERLRVSERENRYRDGVSKKERERACVREKDRLCVCV